MLVWEAAVITFVTGFVFDWLWSNSGVMMVEEGILAWMQNAVKTALFPGRLAEHLIKSAQGVGI